MLLKHTVTCFDEMSLPWINLLLKSGATSDCDPDLIVDHFMKIAGPFHKKLAASYETRTSAQNALLGKQKKFELVPDLYDYAQLWLSLQLVAAKKQKATKKADGASSALKVIASDLIKIFNGNQRWQNIEMNVGEAALISSGLALV